MKVILDIKQKKIQVLEPATLEELAALEGRLAVAFGWQCSEQLEVVSDLLPTPEPSFYPPIFSPDGTSGGYLLQHHILENFCASTTVTSTAAVPLC